MRRVAFVLPYGEPSDGFFPDTLLGLLCADSREAGHQTSMVRVYYDGSHQEGNREIARRLEAWLEERRADVVVVERLFDPEPIRRHLARARGVCVQVTRGDSVEPIDGVDVVVGADPGPTRSGATRRTPSIAELRTEFGHWLAEHDAAPSPPRTRDGPRSVETRPVARVNWRFEPVVEHDTLCLGEPPRIERKVLLGNVGCPYAADPAENPHYRGLQLPPSLPIARRGCAFCSMGGDYEKRPYDRVVGELVAQARHFLRECPEVRELVLTDQYPVKYLARLLRAASEAGLRPTRWLFAARADAFVRDVDDLRLAISAARDTGNVLEVYLSGFEAFSDVELSRYNKGATVADSLAAVAAMRTLRRENPGAFDYARARGHSLILWNPWTTVDDLDESLRVIRENGLRELFSELGRNRLRLYSDLPIYYAAERDGAVTESWGGGGEGAGRRKGYNPELPWRFLDARTRVAHDVAAALRDALGNETELAQLRAATAFARRAPSAGAAGSVDAALRGVAELREALSAIASATARPEGLRKARVERAAAVEFTGACNNACAACANRDAWLDDEPDALAARVARARDAGRAVVLAGREPTLHAAFLDAVRWARGDDARYVGVVTNGRRFAYRPFVAASIAAGLGAASVKLFGSTPAVADSISRDPGGHEQALRGLAWLARSERVAVDVRLPLHRDALDGLVAAADVARAAGAGSLRVEASLDAVGLDRLSAAAEALGALVRRCVELGLPLEASPLEGGTRLFDWIPSSRSGP